MHKQINTCRLVDGEKRVNFGVKNRLHDAKSYSRVNKNYITREFYLHREGVSPVSRGSFTYIMYRSFNLVNNTFPIENKKKRLPQFEAIVLYKLIECN